MYTVYHRFGATEVNSFLFAPKSRGATACSRLLPRVFVVCCTGPPALRQWQNHGYDEDDANHIAKPL